MTSEPLHATFERVTQAGIAAPTAIEPDWRPAADLAVDPAALEPLVVAAGRSFGTTRADISGGRLVETWTWQLALPAAAGLVAEARLPDVGAGNVAAGPGEHGPVLGLRSAAFFALAGDPDAGHPSARVAGGEDALVERLHGGLTRDLAPLVETVAALTRRPQRALWRVASDRLVGAFAWAGDQLGRRDRGCELAARIGALGGPLGAEPDLQVLPVGEGDCLVHVRQGCCLWYRTPAAMKCLGCPLLGDEDRRRMLAGA